MSILNLQACVLFTVMNEITSTPKKKIMLKYFLDSFVKYIRIYVMTLSSATFEKLLFLSLNT